MSEAVSLIGGDEDIEEYREEMDNDFDEEISTLVMRLVLSIVVPMWIAMMLSSLFFVGMRQMIARFGQDDGAVSRELSIQLSANNSFPSALAVPALFG